MKATRLTAALLATLALTACNHEEEPNALSEGQVDIRTTICATAGIGTRATIAPDGSGTFADGDELGLYAHVDNTMKLDNSSYLLNRTTLYWNELSTTEDVTFSAYYPRTATAIATPAAHRFNVAAVAGDASAADLLLATPATGKKGSPVTLDFHHAMHKLTVELSSNVFTSGELATATVKPSGMKGGATVGILGGTVDEAAAYATTETYPAQTGASTTFILAPQTVTTGEEWIRITVAGKLFIYRVPANIFDTSGLQVALSRLESGKHIQLRLNINSTEVTLIGGGISSWTGQGSFEEEINVNDGIQVAKTIDELKTAIANAPEGTAAEPTTIALGDDIEAGLQDLNIGMNSSDGGSSKHIRIDGNGHTITCTNKGNISRLHSNSSLTLANVTIDANNKESRGVFFLYGLEPTLIFEAGVTLKNVGKNSNSNSPACGVWLNSGYFYMKEGSSITGAEYAIDINATNTCVHLQGGTLSDNEQDVTLVLSVSNKTQLKVTVWPKMSGNNREQLRVSTRAVNYISSMPLAEGVTPLTLELKDFSLVKAMSDSSGWDHANEVELYEDNGIIKIRKKN